MMTPTKSSATHAPGSSLVTTKMLVAKISQISPQTGTGRVKIRNTYLLEWQKENHLQTIKALWSAERSVQLGGIFDLVKPLSTICPISSLCEIILCDIWLSFSLLLILELSRLLRDWMSSCLGEGSCSHNAICLWSQPGDRYSNIS